MSIENHLNGCHILSVWFLKTKSEPIFCFPQTPRVFICLACTSQRQRPLIAAAHGLIDHTCLLSWLPDF